jgi:hypothetical protein
VTRARAIAAGIVLVVAVALSAAAAPARERPAELGRMAAEGAVTLSAASGTGHAMITASGPRPGQSVSGLVALANVGESRGSLTLRRTGMADTPGRFGGRLSEVLLLRVEELGGGSWTGPLSGPDALDLGIMEPGEGRSYKLTLTLPDTDPRGRDNGVQGSSVTIDWAWTTESVGPVMVTPTPTATATPTATPAPGTTPAGAAPGAPVTDDDQQPHPVRRAPRLELRIPHQRVLATRGISMFGRCDSRAGSPSRHASRPRRWRAPLPGRCSAAGCSARSAAGATCRARARPSGGSGCG